MRYLVIILTLLLSASCVTQKRCYRKYPPQTTIERHDSTIIRDSIVYHDRVVRDTIEADTVYRDREVKILEKIKIAPLTIENTYSIASAWIENRRLKLELTTKEQVIERIIQDAEREAWYWKERFITEKSTEVVKEKYIPKIYKVALWGWCALIVAITLLLVLRRVFK